MKKISFSQEDALKELGTMASGNAATALAKLTSKNIKITVPRVQIIHALEVPNILGGGDKNVTIIFVTMGSNIKGALVLLLDQNNALKLANLMTKKNEAVLTDFSVAALKECGNICLNSYLNVLNKITGIQVSSSVPEIMTNKLKTSLEEMCRISKINADYSLVLETVFQLNSTVVSGHFLFYLETNYFEKILEGLEEYRRRVAC